MISPNFQNENTFRLRSTLPYNSYCVYLPYFQNHTIKSSFMKTPSAPPDFHAQTEGSPTQDNQDEGSDKESDRASVVSSEDDCSRSSTDADFRDQDEIEVEEVGYFFLLNGMKIFSHPFAA
jgi:hypothetical protein